jgi:hypothetical protein
MKLPDGAFPEKVEGLLERSAPRLEPIRRRASWDHKTPDLSMQKYGLKESDSKRANRLMSSSVPGSLD